MALLIEAYGAEGAIALSNHYSFPFLSALLEQSAKLRSDPQEQEQEALEDWIKENRDRSFEIKTDKGIEKVNLKSFLVGNPGAKQ